MDDGIVKSINASQTYKLVLFVKERGTLLLAHDEITQYPIVIQF